MFLNNKINYIFASFGDEKACNYEKILNKSFFFKRFIHKFKKKQKPKIKNNPSRGKDTFELSEKFISKISKFTEKKCYSFYYNLESSHDQFINEIEKSDADRFYVFSLYPQFRTDLSLIANFFSLNLYDEITNKVFWVKSFHNNLVFIKAIQKIIKALLKKANANEKDTIFMFLADAHKHCPLFTFECEITCQSIIKTFQFVEGSLYFFKKNKHSLLKSVTSNSRKNVVLVPITTLIDDAKTKKEIESLKGFLEKQNKNVLVCKTLNHNSYFVRSVIDIIDEKSFVSNKMITSF